MQRLVRIAADKTAAFVIPYGKGQLECRLVRREPKPHQPKYLSAYLSSHSGCTMGCKQCHLTENGSTSFKHATVEAYQTQMRMIMDHHRALVKKGEVEEVERVSVNLMARGEPLANKHIVNNYDKFYAMLKEEAGKADLKVNLSTIMPVAIRDHYLSNIFRDLPVEIYYSLYSLNPKFRSHWLPNAMPVDEALGRLKRFQENSYNLITFHWAFIKGHNDNVEEVKEIARVLRGYNFRGKFNLVRYNPPNKATSEPCEEKLQELLEIMKGSFNYANDVSRCKIINRVGEGEKTMASCGMFFKDL
ncbi:Ribosomal RNA large subunit methyltransferase N |uniref:Fe-S-cluster redox domain-containing n=1 Tax=Kaumoebavirus TaxID=1859492 RepID=UPI0009C289AE|nr:Fe-S-cluster redox domain-containing [Kaumoebavirus]ARA72110.1 Ribosomal RNA large subunit methyltransferase N \